MVPFTSAQFCLELKSYAHKTAQRAGKGGLAARLGGRANGGCGGERSLEEVLNGNGVE